MKESSKGNKKIEKQLLAYGFAAGATLAMASPAGAAIHPFTSTNGPISNGFLPIDMDGNGTTEFSIAHSWSHNASSTGFSAGKIIKVAAGAQWRGPGSFAANLPSGAVVNAGTNNMWKSNQQKLFTFALSYGQVVNASGNFGPLQPGYLGVKFDISGGTHYGWIYIDHIATGGRTPGSFEVISWAYQDQVGKPIIAGATHAPIPSALALLASGVAGLVALRRRNREEQQQ